MRSAQRSRQDGFIREIFWLALGVAVVAVVFLDSMALFNAHQASHDNASSAIRAAQTEYAQSQSVAAAKQAAEQYLEKGNVRLIAFKTGSTFDGSTGFVVTTEAHTDTYAFKYLKYVPGAKDWVRHMQNPVSTESAQ